MRSAQPPASGELFDELAEAMLRLNSEPAVLARMLERRAGLIAPRSTSDGDKWQAVEDRIRLAARDLAEKRHALEATRSSWSWRLTAPLRCAMDVARTLTWIASRPNGWRGLIHWLRYRSAIRASGLFDDDYYRRNDPTVTHSGLNPLLHYFVTGSAENRKPNSLFDGAHYRLRYPDVESSGLDPLVHYWRIGGLEGRAPHPQFDGKFYLAQNPELVDRKINPLAHFLGPGILEGCWPNPSFDPLTCLEHYRDLAALGINPVLYCLEHGCACSP